MQESKGTFLLEFCVAVPWILFAAILVGSSARPILPVSGKPAVQAPHPGARVLAKSGEPARANAPRALASTAAARADDKGKSIRKKTAPPLVRKAALRHPPNTVVGTLQTLPNLQEDPEKY